MSSIFSIKNCIVQGITGSSGSAHTRRMLDYGTTIIAGTSPNKAVDSVHGVKVFSSIQDIVKKDDLATIDASVIFVPPRFAKGAILEAIDAKIPYIFCITEGIPLHDMRHIAERLTTSSSVLIGPNCPGALIPGLYNIGIIPPVVATPGSVAIVSRSGTLTYEVAAELTSEGIGQRAIIGIGGDPIRGTNFVDCLRWFEEDDETAAIVMIGEIGGQAEHLAGEYCKKNITKPVFSYIAGHFAPKNTQLGHAGAILRQDNETAQAKTQFLSSCGVTTALTLPELASEVKKWYTTL